MPLGKGLGLAGGYTGKVRTAQTSPGDIIRTGKGINLNERAGCIARARELLSSNCLGMVVFVTDKLTGAAARTFVVVYPERTQRCLACLKLLGFQLAVVDSSYALSGSGFGST